MMFIYQGKWGVEEGEIPKSEYRNPKLDARPNPFTAKTVIKFRSSGVAEFNSQLYDSLTPQLKIYALSGRVVRTFPIADNQSPIAKITWDGRDEKGRALPGGIYFAKLVTNEEEQILKLILLR